MPQETTPPRDESGKFTKQAAAQPSTTKTEAPKKEEKTFTKSKVVLDFVNDLISGRPSDADAKAAETKDADAAKKPEKAAEDAAKAKPEDTPAKKPESKKEDQKPTKPAAKPAEQSPIDYTKLAEATATAVARTLKPAEATNKLPEKPQNPDADLPPDEQRKLQVLRHLEKTNPDKYKGVSDKYKSNLKKFEEYRKTWETKHPDEEFDADAEEHTAFYDKNDLYEPYEEKDFIEAMTDMKAESKKAEIEKNFNQRLDQVEREKKALQERPHIAKDQTESAQVYWSLVGGDFEGLVKPNGELDSEKVKSIDAKMPGLIQQIIGDASFLDTNIENLRLLRKGLIDQVKAPPVESLKQSNPEEYAEQLQRYQSHRYLSDFAFQLEREIASRPTDKQLDGNGRQFVTNETYSKLPENQRGNVWRLVDIDPKTGRPYLQTLLIAKEASKIRAYVKSEEDKFNKWAEARGMVPKGSLLNKDEGASGEQTPTQSATEKLAEKAAIDEETLKSPSSGASPKSATSADESKKAAGGGVSNWFSDF